jgi:head-tail adaptor
MRAGSLDRRIQFQRYVLEDDGFSEVKKWADHGSEIWASKTDLKDWEKLRGDGVSASLTSRFQVRSSVFTRGLTVKDAIKYSGVTYEIFGIKELGRNDILEITAGAEVSNGNSQA